MAGRQSVIIEPDIEEELREKFEKLDADNNSKIDLDELGPALELCGLKLPAYEVRKLQEDVLRKGDTDGDQMLDLNEFRNLYIRLKKEGDMGIKFKKSVTTRTGVQQLSGTEGSTHSVKDTERVAFAEWINRNLQSDEDCKSLLPIDPESSELFEKVHNGILLCKLINSSVPETIDERTINKNPKNVYLMTENHNLALNSAQAIGCNVVNIGHADLLEGKTHLVLGLLWQIIRIGLLSEINLTSHPGLVLLLEEGEEIEDLLKLSPEEILIRWVNYHLNNAGVHKRIKNFSSDITDSEAYTYLLHQIAPKDAAVNLGPLGEPEGEMRAEAMLMEADKIGCRAFVTSKDVVKGNAKLNLAFVANLFNTYPALDKPDDAEFDIVEETREEKTYRNWMNSLGVNPHVNYLYSDLQSGLIYFQLYDIIKKGCVDWKKVVQKFNKMRVTFEKIGNCNYAVELGKNEMKFSLTGTGGKDLFDGTQNLTLGLVWQLMRAYTLSILKAMSEDGKPIEDKVITRWANERLKEGSKDCTVASFQDQTLSDGITILSLIDCIAPKKINWEIVKRGGSPEENMSNAKYAISMGRKIGARMYALPEDIVEVKPKMVMTIFACLMTVDWRKAQQDKE